MLWRGLRPCLHGLVVLCWVQQNAEGGSTRARALAFGTPAPLRGQAREMRRAPVAVRSQVSDVIALLLVGGGRPLTLRCAWSGSNAHDTCHVDLVSLHRRGSVFHCRC
jgi:hypothetical protein